MIYRNNRLFLASMLLANMSLSASQAKACDTETLEQAVQLVMQNHAVLTASNDYYRLQSKQSNWKANLQLAYSGIDNGDTPNAGIQLEIPLFDRSQEINLVKTRVSIDQQRDGILSSFMQAVKSHCSDKASIDDLNQQRQFYRDRLQYQQQRVDEGLEEAVTLWGHAKALQEAEQSYQEQLKSNAVQVYTIARQYGGMQWKQLINLLDEKGS